MTNGLFIGGGADFLGELVDFGYNVGDFVQRRAEVVSKAKAFLDDTRALFHVFDAWRASR